MRTRAFDWIALTLVVIGAINWGLLGFFQFDIIAAIFGGADMLVSRIIYAIIGLCGLYCLSFFARLDTADSYSVRTHHHDNRID